jgi:hypothetical protein
MLGFRNMADLEHRGDSETSPSSQASCRCTKQETTHDRQPYPKWRSALKPEHTCVRMDYYLDQDRICLIHASRQLAPSKVKLLLCSNLQSAALQVVLHSNPGSGIRTTTRDFFSGDDETFFLFQSLLQKESHSSQKHCLMVRKKA